MRFTGPDARGVAAGEITLAVRRCARSLPVDELSPRGRAFLDRVAGR